MEIQIPRLVYEKVMYWVDNCPIEVSGFGKCTWYPETKVLWIEDAHLLKQEGGAAHTDIDAQSMSSLMFKTRPQPGELRWWWHSHVDMAVFWSGQDKKTIEELGSQGWIAATVFNKKREMRSAFGIKTSVNTFFGTSNEVRLVDDVNTFVMDDIDPEIKEQWAKDLADNVIQKKYTPPTPAVSDTLLLPGVDVYDEGIIGYGTEREAKAIGMSPKKFRQILASNNMGEIADLEIKVMRALDEGKLRWN